ncbi:MAG: DnaJ domain-containing protein [Nitrospirae bacterium]|nr:DnaJ domain-containing protein [Nitrospirota bacterium]MBF0592505.1 DnaJ domain-containing protein [Nitrospirota bacterium]
MYSVNEVELYDACKILFGEEVKIDRGFLEYIQPSGLKSAYRKIALATHPDRNAAEDEAYKKTCTQQFIEATEAYEKLNSFLKQRENGFRLKESYVNTFKPQKDSYTGNFKTWHQSNPNAYQGQSAKSTQQAYYGNGSRTSSNNTQQQQKTESAGFSSNGFSARQADRHNGRDANGQTNNQHNRQTNNPDGRFTIDTQKTSTYAYQSKNLPRRKLRIGEFLYYAGIVSWKDLIAAIVWQSKQRQRMGEIAVRWGWLNEEKIVELLRGKVRGERLGDCLVRLNVITPFQCNMLVWQQQKSQKPIGEYFVREKLLSEMQINRYLKHLKDHNIKF